MYYDITQPVDIVFNAIEDLTKLADHGNYLMTKNQMINLAFVILAKQPILLQDLCHWIWRITGERTWPNMLTHFHYAQSDPLNSLPTAANCPIPECCKR